ncbi:MAG: hypothetical protein AABY83_06730 [Pseudomonadota bacterium]
MVAISRWGLVLGALAMSNMVFASGPKFQEKSVQDADYYSFNNDEIVLFAHAKMLHAIDQANLSAGKCDEKRMKTTVPARTLPEVILSKREWGVALTYLSAKAMTRCGEEALNRAFITFVRFKNVEKALLGSNKMNTDPYSMELICCMSERGKLETELQYLKIDSKIRQILEETPALKEPFNPILTLEAMGR